MSGHAIINRMRNMRKIKLELSSCARRSVLHGSMRSTIKGNRGFTLLEALIGFLVLSVGMLGIASLQAMSLKAGKTSVYNSIATMKVDEIIESMRANPTALASYVGAGGGASGGCSTGSICLPAQLAADDVFWWSENLKAGLPAAATTNIAVVAAVPPSRMAVVTVNVNWQERSKTTSSGEAKGISTTAFVCTQSPC